MNCNCGCNQKVKEGNIYIHGHNQKGMKKPELFKKMKMFNLTFNEKFKKHYLAAMKEKVWNNEKRNNKISEKLMNNKNSGVGELHHSYKEKLILVCGECNKEFKICPSLKNKRKHCSAKCYSNYLKRMKMEYMKELGLFNFPNIGKFEKEILDNLSSIIGYKILRQHQVKTYFLDGYIPELNLAIEIDETYHEKQPGKDLRRENNIKKELDCKFMRIKI